jgi:RNA polymerase sigma factor (sigma-70 family)
MNDGRSDFQLLREFTRPGSQAAFAEVVRRHLDLVYATALRKVQDTGGAEEIAQNVFTILARKAWQFGPDDSLPAWLYKTTLLEAREWWRGELRRRRREQTAAELGTTMNLPNDQSGGRALLPLLDEALLSLREKDRLALLLRYYEKQPLREVGAALGVNEDTAQKRVATALEKLAGFFQRRGFRTATVAGAAALLESTSLSAPTAATALVVDAALKSAPAVSGLTAILARFTGLSKVQTAALCAVLAVGPAAWQWSSFHRERDSARQLNAQLSSTQTELTTLTAEVEHLRQSAARLANAGAGSNQSGQSAGAGERFEAWKKHLRDRLLAADFQWTDDSPFVRIPKSLLRALSVDTPISRPGLLSPAARELLGLTPQERQDIENALQKHVAGMDDMMSSRAYETNVTRRLSVPTNAVASKILFLPALGDDAKASADELQAALAGTLGPDRWKLLKPYWEQRGTSTLQRILNLDANETEQEIAAWISQENGDLVVRYGNAVRYASTTSGGIGLDSFLPGATNEPISLPNGKILDLPLDDRLGIANLSAPLKQQILDWAQHEAEDRIPAKRNP